MHKLQHKKALFCLLMLLLLLFVVVLFSFLLCSIFLSATYLCRWISSDSLSQGT